MNNAAGNKPGMGLVFVVPNPGLPAALSAEGRNATLNRRPPV